MARPTKSSSLIKKTRSIRATDQEWTDWEKAAKKIGVNRNTLIAANMDLRDAVSKLLTAMAKGRPADPRDGDKWDRAVSTANFAMATETMYCEHCDENYGPGGATPVFHGKTGILIGSKHRACGKTTTA